MGFFDFFRRIGSGFKALGGFIWKVFKSEQAQAVFQTILENILPEAKPIVESIRRLVGSPTTATVDQIIALYTSFGKTLEAIKDDPGAKAIALRNLAFELITDALPDKYDTPLINAAIELALSGIKAEEK